MRVETLEGYNVPPDILEIWRRHVGPELLPVQERAVKEFGLFGTDNLIVFSPTSSGKTFVGEMAAVKAARENTKVFYLVPQKALAAEKFEELRRRYEPAGISVVVSSRDRREFDDQILRRDFQIAVVVFEKLEALLVSRPQLMNVVGLVVVDELQIITDRERGPTLELLLTKLRLAQPRPRIIGLSAVLGRSHTLAEWLGARLLVETRRPVELRKGVLCRGTFRYVEHNSGREGSEELPDFRHARREELVLAATEELVRRGEQVLTFLPDRASTVQMARLLAARVTPGLAEQAARELGQLEETHAREALLEVLGSAVAFHNSDLAPEERAVVERHFRAGAIRCLFSTSTLAVGMNLPVKNVVLDGRKWEFLRRYGRWSMEDITKSEYENMSGRAGRLSLVSDFGRSILVTASPFEADVWLRHYVGSDFEDIRPMLGDAPLEDHLLDVLASGLAATPDEVEGLLLGSFTGHVHWAQRLSREELALGLGRAVELCAGGDLVRRRPGPAPGPGGDRLEITPVGRACAAKGIGARTGIAMAAWAREAAAAAPADLEVLAVASFTAEGDDVYVGLTKEERYRADYRAQLLGRAAAQGLAARPVFADLAAEQNAAEYEAAKAIKKALLLADWIDELPTKELEARYHVWAGGIRRIGEEYGWVVDALAEIARACRWPDDRAAALARLAERLTHGVREDALGVARLRAQGLGRALVRRLVDAGFRTPDELAAAPKDLTGAWFAAARTPPVPPRSAQQSWAPLAPTIPVAVEGAARAADAEALPNPTTPPLLTVDLRERKVVYRGVEIPTRPPRNLQRLPLLALAVLAARAGRSITVTELAEEMQRLGGANRRLIAPETRDLRYKLLMPFRHALRKKVAPEEIDHLVEALAGSALRLNVPGPVSVVAAQKR
jgi:helicase